MKVTVRLFAALLLIVGLAGRTEAQTLTSTVEGTVTDESGAVLPGVTVTLTGPRGSQTAVSDAKGQYRFVAVDPDSYTLKVELQGFSAQELAVKVDINKTSTADFALKVGGLSEAVNVSAEASTVDVKSSATNNTVSNAMLQMTPLYSSTSTGLLNAAPGINSSSAFGGQGSYGNALLLDGVDTRDPEGGSAWTFFNQNLIDEIQIGGLGAPAEYGGFTGAIVNTIMKSGSNAYSGLFSMRYTDKGLSSNNVSPAVIAQNGSLGQAAVLKKLKDYTVQVGGPIKHDKAFFFASVQRYSDLFDPSGPVSNNPDVSPRFNVKFTLQPKASDSFVLGTQYDSYNLKGRVGNWPSAQATDDKTVTEDAPEWVWNAQWRHIFNTNTLLEAKFTGYSGYYYLDPVNPAPVAIDFATNTYSGGGGGLYYADRTRNQAQVSLTKYAQLAGSHSFKFGAEIERSHVRSQYQPYGPQGFYIYQYAGVPYYQVSYGNYDVQGDNHRTSAYAQDQWSMGRATLNIGLRMDKITGYSPQLKQTVYTPHSAWGPRVGLAYNLTKAGTSALKGFWGRYYEGAAASFFTQATPGLADDTQTPLDANGNVIGPTEITTPGQVFGIDKDISHPRTDEFNVSYEQQLMRGIGRLTVTGVWRNGGNFLNNVISDARWNPVTVPNLLAGGTLTAYAWANPDASNQSFQIRNTKGFQYLDPSGNVITTADPTRKYKALMLVLTNQLKGRFGYQGSYVLSKSTGNVDNSGEGAYEGNSSWNSPNTMFINAFGELTNSRRHEIKAFLTYRVPVIDLMVAANYTGLSGRPYTPFEVLSSSQLAVTGSARRTIFLEPRGSERAPFTNQTDLRVEKVFQVQSYRFGVYADWVNLFNAAGITGIQGRVPSSGGVAFGAPTSLQGARQITFGGRWSF